MQKYRDIDELRNSLSENSFLKFQIKVNANAKNDLIEFSDDFIKIRIKAPAIEGKANKAIIEFISKTLKVAKSKVKILNGEKSSIKTIEVRL